MLDGTPRMRERPIAELVDALQRLGVDVRAEGHGGCPPVRARGGAPFGGEVEVDARRSSQYVSALLLIAPYAARSVVLRLRDGALVSRPYVDVTLDVMRAFGADGGLRRPRDAAGRRRAQPTPRAPTRSSRTHRPPRTSSRPPPSPAAACASMGLPGASAQADMGFLAMLERMGCEVVRDAGQRRGARAAAPGCARSTST